MHARTDATDARTAVDQPELALHDARQAAAYDFDLDTADTADLLGVETRFDRDDDPAGFALAWMLSPSTYVLHAAATQPTPEAADGAQPGQTAPRETRTFTFENADGDDDDALAFTVVDEWTNHYDDQKVAVETPAPWDVPDDFDGDAPNDIVKSLPWNDDDAADHATLTEGVHYKFDDSRKAWTLDAHGLDALQQAAEAEGYAWADERDADPVEYDDELTALAEFAQRDDTIAVTYAKKNGNGENVYAGTVQDASAVGDKHYGHANGVTATEDRVVFLDTDGKGKKVKRDDDGVPSLYSSGYHPYMGAVVEIRVEPHERAQ